MKLRIILILIFFFSCSFAGSISDELVRSDAHLNKVKALIDEENKTITNIKDKKKAAAKNLKKAELELSYHRKLSRKLEAKLKKLNKQINEIRFKKTTYKNREKNLIDDIRSANHYLAGAGETDLLEGLILANELTELTASMQIISRVNQNLFTKVEELHTIQKELSETETKLKAKEEELKLAAVEKKNTVNEFNKKRMLVKQLYKIAEEDENIKKEFVTMLNRKQAQLERKLNNLKLKLKEQNTAKRFWGLKKQFKHMRGSLEWPVNGKITERFGKKKVKGFRGVVHKKGIKISPKETLVSSVYDGIVIHTDTAWGLGWFVIVEHFGGYYTLYANLDEIKVRNKQKVHTGEILGTIDIDHQVNTPYLYFEIRIHDKAVDPTKWLTS